MKYASLDKAIRIAAVAFEGDFDKGGQPYILHLLRVMEKMPKHDYKARMIAVLHDLMEDKSEWTHIHLLKEGFHPKVVHSLIMLNHIKFVPYMDYIKDLADDQMARMVKMADLEDNSDITRLKGVTQKDLDRINKYNIAYNYLKDIDNE